MPADSMNEGPLRNSAERLREELERWLDAAWMQGERAMDAMGVAEIRRGAQQQLVHDAEHRGVRTDPEAEGRDDRDRESGLQTKAADGVLEIVLQVVEDHIPLTQAVEQGLSIAVGPRIPSS